MKMKKIEMPADAATTKPGSENKNGQVVVSKTGFPSGTFAGQTVYKLHCKHCGNDYGSNGCDVHKRKCPDCQGGAKGEKLREPGPGLFD